MNRQHLTVGTDRVDKEYSFIEALSLGPRESLSLVSKESLGLINSQPGTPTIPITPITPTHAHQFPSAPHNLSPPHSLSPPGSVSPPRSIRRQPYHQHQAGPPPQVVSRQLTTKRSAAIMTSSTKAQTQCLELCHKTTSVGDRVSIRMLEYLSTVTKQPNGLDTLAHDFLDTCEILFSIEAGLGECIRTGQAFPSDVISELSKKFRVTQADFQLLEQMLGKFLENERKGAMGRMRRGWGKIFGDHDIDRMIGALGKTRESLRMSALMFQWSIGNEKIEREMGIGYTGLAAALDRMDHRAGISRSKTSDGPASHYRPSSSSQHRGVEGNTAPSQHSQPPLPPLPWTERSSSMHNENIVSPSADHIRQYSGNGHTASSVSSNERYHSGTTATFDRMSTFDEAHETHSHSGMSESAEASLEELAGLELNNNTKVVRLKADPAAMPRWNPRSAAGGDAVNLRSALLSAVRGKNHKLVEQLLDRGVNPNTGSDQLALKEAVLNGDAESVRLLLLFGADPNVVDRNGSGPLLTAVERGSLASAVPLLKYGADPNLDGGHDQESPLSEAAIRNNLNMVHLLLIYGGNPDQLTASGDTLVIAATSKKTPKKLVDLLLDYGSDPNNKSREGKTALFEAIQNSRVDIVNSLLDHGANPNLPGPKHMLWPATYQTPCLQILLAHGADYKKCPGIMELATSVNNLESVRVLLKHGVDPNAKKDGVYTPLCTSIRDNRNDIFQLLLANGADPNTPASEYPAFKCITHNRLQYLAPLVAAGANLRSPKGIVETAVSVNNMEALNWLLDQGLNANDKTPKGHSPLTTAIRENRIDMIDTLLARGADPNIRGQDWPVCMAVRNPAILKRILAVLAEPRAFKGVMEMAVVAGQLESVKLLIAAGVSVEDKNGGVFSPLTSAIREDRRDIVQFLVKEGGADLNSPGEHLPVVKALRRHRDDTEILEFLLENGADPNKLYRGWNGIMQAVENGDETVLRLLADKAGVDLEVRDELGRSVTEIAASRGWDEAVQILNDGRLKR
ncbi:ankyrin repeat-containing domain protein [Dactylonectria macrodidyma]|uniref:Ankyrin repeat-containing domain protein n=1 Tax=Dactylonectria macrodidyma TaxID=307937 RepID=A0A9P9FGL4_9HYPO|nr:ankyrin repeat-containing domain protein [Dactylonectria macrodidyma]